MLIEHRKILFGDPEQRRDTCRAVPVHLAGRWSAMDGQESLCSSSRMPAMNEKLPV